VKTHSKHMMDSASELKSASTPKNLHPLTSLSQGHSQIAILSKFSDLWSIYW